MNLVFSIPWGALEAPFSVWPLEPLAQGWAHLRHSVWVLWSWGGAGHQMRPLGHSSPIWKVVGDPGFRARSALPFESRTTCPCPTQVCTHLLAAAL